MSVTLAKQIAMAAVGRAFPNRDVKNAESIITEGTSQKVKATVEIDGVISRGFGSDQAASPSPLFDALLVELSRGVDKRTLAAKRRAAVKLVKAAGGGRVLDHVCKTDSEFAALVADCKADVTRHFPKTAKKGSLKFTGGAEVIAAKVSKT